MTYLLDTHVFLWSAFAVSALSDVARAVIADSSNTVAVSVVSFWELSLKFGIGKLELAGTTPDALPDVARSMSFEILELAADEAASFHRLPREAHRGPFDRMLVWQAIERKMPLVTRDSSLSAYEARGLRVVW